MSDTCYAILKINSPSNNSRILRQKMSMVTFSPLEWITWQKLLIFYCICTNCRVPLLLQWEYLWWRIVSWLFHLGHTHIHSLTISWRFVCVCVCVVRMGGGWDLPAISITVSPAKWGERHRQPTGRLLPFWGSGSRGPDCFAQGQHDSGIVIYILVDCVLLFHAPPRKPEHAIAWPEFDINCTPPRRSSTSPLEFVGVKTKPWHSSSIQNKIMFVLGMAGCGLSCPRSLRLLFIVEVVFWCVDWFFFFFASNWHLANFQSYN